MKVYSKIEEKIVDMIPCLDWQKSKVIGFQDPNDSVGAVIPLDLFEIPEFVDWEQRRYEIAKDTLQVILNGFTATKKDIEDNSEPLVKCAVYLADALIAELRKQPNPETKPEKHPDKKEVAIGNTVEYNGEHLRCVEKSDNEDCSGCAFLAEDDDCKFSGYCYKELRSDGKNVIFVKGGSSEA